MTPASLRAAIASARLRPRMYAQTAEHLASMLYGMIAGAASDGVDVGPAWGDAYSPANVHAPTDAEVCDAAEATVAALWPQGDAPAGDECAAYSAAPLDTPMPPAFVEALASLSPAQPGALDLDALHARVTLPTCSQCGAVDPPTEDAERWDGQRFLRHVDCPKPDDIYASEVGDHGLTRAEQRALVARVRELEALVPSERDRRNTTALHGLYADGEREIDRLTAEAERLRKQLDARDRRDAAVQAFVASMPGNEDRCPQCDGQPLAEGTVCATCWGTGRNDVAQPVPLDFYGALAAVRNGRFVPGGGTCVACDATWPDGAENCPACGRPDYPAAPPVDPAWLFAAFDAMGVPMLGARYVERATGEVFEVEAVIPFEGGACLRGLVHKERVATIDALARDYRREDEAPMPVDRDLCPKCGTLDLDHACPKSAATVAGEAFAAEHPYAAAGIMGSATAREGKG